VACLGFQDRREGMVSLERREIEVTADILAHEDRPASREWLAIQE